MAKEKDQDKDIINQINKIAKQFEKEIRSKTNFRDLLEDALLSSEKLQKQYGSINKMQEAMASSEKKYKKIAAQVLKIQKEQITKAWKPALKAINDKSNLLKKEEDAVVTVLGHMKHKKDIEKNITKLTKKELKLIEAENKHRKSGLKLLDEKYEISEKISKLSSALNPAVLFGGAAIFAVKSIIGVFTEYYDFLDKKVMPATANLNKELGNFGTAQLKRQVISTGVQFEFLGKTFEEGAKAATDLASSMMAISVPKDTLRLGLKLSEYVGLGAENAGKLLNTFVKTGSSAGDLDGVMKDATKTASKYGVPVNQIRRDMGENIDILQRFGTTNSKEMLKSSAKARQLGTSIREVNAAYGEQLDTFKGSSDAAAKLNTIFGTQINSYKLMLETDPVKRMMMLRKELDKQGKSWDKLNVFEQNVITSTFGVSKEQAALQLSSEKTRKKLQAQAAEQAKTNKINNEWERGLSNIKSVLIAWGPLFDALKRSVAGFVSKLFGFKNAADPIHTITQAISQSIQGLTKWINNLNPDPIADLSKGFKAINVKNIEKIVTSIKDFGTSVIDYLRSDDIKDAIESVKSLSGALVTLVKPLEAVGKLKDEWSAAFVDTDAKESEIYHNAIDRMIEDRMKKEKALTHGSSTVNLLDRMAKVRDGGSYKDALITKKGEVIGFDPQDNILATKSPVVATQHGAMAAAGNINTSQHQPQSLNDIRIEVVDVYLDSRKIGEMQVRLSRD